MIRRCASQISPKQSVFWAGSRRLGLRKGCAAPSLGSARSCAAVVSLPDGSTTRPAYKETNSLIVSLSCYLLVCILALALALLPLPTLALSLFYSLLILLALI